MKWNWQQDSWPSFSYDQASLERYETAFLQQSGMFLGTLKHLGEEDKSRLTVEVISNEAVTTSEIEGEVLNRDSVQSSIRRQFGLATDARKIAPAEQGIAAMMTDLYRHFDKPLSESQLFAWHSMVMRGRTDLNVGRYRDHPEPMQIVSGPIGKTRVHFEAPPSRVVPREIKRFIAWFNETAPEAKQALPPLARAGIAHVYFESIHPFEDGNGRIGRAISEKALSQGLRRPTLIALAQTINHSKRDYYQALAENNNRLDITGWVTYFARLILEAQGYTQCLSEFLIEKARLYDRLRGKLNARQEKVLARLFREGLGGFKGGLSAEKYLAITKTSRATATRDLQELVELGVLHRTGERKHTRYSLALPAVSGNPKLPMS